MYSRLLTLWLLPAILLADVIFLRNGQSLEGKIQRQDRTSIQVETPNGTRTIPRIEVRRITFGTVDDVALQRQQEELRRREEERAAEAERTRLELEKAEQEQKQKELAESRSFEAGNLARSMVLPGWGHLARGQIAPGAAYLGGAAVLGGATAILRSQALVSRNAYRSSTLRNNLLALQLAGTSPLSQSRDNAYLYSAVLNQRARGNYQSAVGNYNTLLALDLAFYLFQLAHLGFPVSEGNRPVTTAVDFQFSGRTAVEPNSSLRKNDLAWQFAWSFKL